MFGRNNTRSKLIVGVIVYGKLTEKYLPYFLSSLKKQTYKNFDIFIIDNTEKEDNGNKKFIKEKYPEINFVWAGGNIGFSSAYNIMINGSIEVGTDLFLMLNPDIILNKDAIEKMVYQIKSDKVLGSVCPKIMRWDFGNNKKTNIIDSLGLKMAPGLRFVDVGQGRVDDSNFDDVDIMGPSGAAAMYKISALKKISEDGNFFDELMFMYKEDCDLNYRLYIAGYKSKCVTGSVVYHDRTASSDGGNIFSIIKSRKTKNNNVKKWSFVNQQIIYIKYWGLQSLLNKIIIVFYEITFFVFIVFFERFLLKEIWSMRKIVKNIKRYK